MAVCAILMPICAHRLLLLILIRFEQVKLWRVWVAPASVPVARSARRGARTNDRLRVLAACGRHRRDAGATHSDVGRERKLCYVGSEVAGWVSRRTTSSSSAVGRAGMWRQFAPANWGYARRWSSASISAASA